MRFWKETQGKSLNQIWQSSEVEDARKELREHLQEILRHLCRHYKKKVIPVYVSLKPKRKHFGYFIYKKQLSQSGRRITLCSIVIFPVAIKKYPYSYDKPQDVYIRSYRELIDTLSHEFTHYLLMPDNKTHNWEFFKKKQKVDKLIKKQLGGVLWQ